MSHLTSLRAEPCSTCGRSVSRVETTSGGLGGGNTVRRAPFISYQHTESPYAGDQVDAECTMAVAN
jgi:hypothetical protein